MSLIVEYWKAGLEILILWAGLYWLWVFFRGTRGAKVLTGLAVLFLVNIFVLYDALSAL